VSSIMFDFILGGAVALFILGYLVYALLRPERF
jgi:K+-transporting ATPase KdpF subunit